MILSILIAVSMVTVAYVIAEVMHYRKGHDVYEWTKKLANWMDTK